MFDTEDGRFTALIWSAGLNPLVDLRGLDLGKVRIGPEENLAHFDLRECRFEGSDMRGVDLTKAKVDGADFSNADLRGTAMTSEQWKTVFHTGASLLGSGKIAALPKPSEPVWFSDLCRHLDVGSDVSSDYSNLMRWYDEFRYAFLENICRHWLTEGELNADQKMAFEFYLSLSLLLQGHLAQAEQILRELVSDLKKNFGERHQNSLAAQYYLARAMLDRGQVHRAEQAFRELLPKHEEFQDGQPSLALPIRFFIARAMIDQERLEEADAALSKLLPEEIQLKGVEHPDTIVTATTLAGVRARRGIATSEAPSLRSVEAAFGSENPNLGLRLVDLGEVAAADDLLDEAATLFDRAERVWRGRLADEAIEWRKLAQARARWGIGAEGPGEG
ncbi:MAG: pentapeptide repeat-containing protein [Pseudomonadota bacterium]